VRETFRLDHGDRGCAIWNFGCARYAVAEDGAVVMKAADGVAATGFEVEVVSSGRDAAQRIAAVADAVVVVVGTRGRDLQHGAAAGLNDGWGLPELAAAWPGGHRGIRGCRPGRYPPQLLGQFLHSQR